MKMLCFASLCFSVFFLFQSVAPTYGSSDRESAKSFHGTGFSQDDIQSGSKWPSGLSNMMRRNQKDKDLFKEKYEEKRQQFSSESLSMHRIINGVRLSCAEVIMDSIEASAMDSTALRQTMELLNDIIEKATQQQSNVRARMVQLERRDEKLNHLPEIKPEAEFKLRLLHWVQKKTAQNSYVNVKDFSQSWADGMAFAALVSHFCPGKIPIDTLTPKTRLQNFELAFKVADEELDVYPLLNAWDMVAWDAPDWKQVFAYVNLLYLATKGKDRERMNELTANYIS